MGSFRALPTFRSYLCLLTLSTAVFAGTAHGQDRGAAVEAQAPAHVSVVHGIAVLERDGRSDDSPGNMPLLAGDRIRTREGRVEVLFADGSTLHLDHHTTIDLQSDELVRLVEGRIRLSIPGATRAVSYRVDSPHGWVQIFEAGEYRAALIPSNGATELEVAVLRGRAELVNEDGRTALRAGERAFARADAAPSYAYVFNSAAGDAFDHWSEARRSERLGLSTQYLPDEVRPYAASFDRHGSWRYEASYGHVWYPRVDAGWRPYYRGRWVTLRPYGVTWVSMDPWGWPTHHYGRWGFSGGTWFWIPGRTWGPAWVSWAYAPGYVSWCPLGWNNRPVVQIVNVNIYGGYDPWRAWTVVPQRHFGAGLVHRRVVTAHAIDDRTRRAFSPSDRAPAITGYAVPRGSAGVAPIRVAGTAPERRSVPLLTNRGSRASDAPRPSTGRAVPRELGGSRTPDAARPPAGRAIPRELGASRPGITRPSDARPDTAVAPGIARERAMPTRPMVRSPRREAAPQSDPPAARPRTPPNGAYQPDNRPRSAPAPVRRNDGYRASPDTYRRDDGYRARPEPYGGNPSGRAVPRQEYARPGTLPRPEGARPEAARPGYGPPPSYGRPPSYGPRPGPGRAGPPSGPGGGGPPANPARSGPPVGRPGPSSVQPPAPDGGGPPAAGAPAPGSRPRGGVPSQGTARPKGGN